MTRQLPIGELKKGDLILVTGASGLIGSNVVDDLLSRGFRVRGTTRHVTSKLDAMNEKVNKMYGPGMLEWVETSNGEEPDAFKPHLKDVAGIIHLALEASNIFGGAPNLDLAVGHSVNMTVGVAKAATEFPNVKALVVTSSYTACYVPEFGKDIDASVDEYNEMAVKMARELPIDHPFKAAMVYVATKTIAEQELWKWVDSAKPHFRVNTILPHLNLGAPFNPAEGVYSTSTWTKWIYEGNVDPQTNVGVAFWAPTSWIINVKDCAAIHSAALIDPHTHHKRLWAAGTPPVGINEVLKIWRDEYPDRKGIPEHLDIQDPPKQGLKKGAEDALIEKYTGRTYIDLKETALQTLADSR